MVAIKIGMTGTREGASQEALNSFYRYLMTIVVEEAHHGDCVGADQQFHQLVTQRGIKTIVHPPIKGVYRAHCQGTEIRECKDYLDRNRDIVDECDILVAFPKSKVEEARSGTWYTVRYSYKQDKPVMLFYPDGSMSGSG